MISLVLLIGVILIMTGYIMMKKDYCSDYEAPIIIGVITVGIFSTIMIIMLSIYPFRTEEKIKMYEDENKIIEEKIKNTVRSYINYEQETYQNMIQNSELQTLLISFPELNSNELVKSEISIYVSNNNKIKKLKELLIDKKTMNWWLYFGN